MNTTTSITPQNYQEWRYCITVECGIILTLAYVMERIDILSEDDNEETRRFCQQYGDSHRQKVVQWFKQSQVELS